jgi:hypothetical protein
MLSVCPAHEAGSDQSLLAGVRFQQVVASRHVIDEQVNGEPIDLWLIDDTGACTSITTGSDWCLIVDASAPHDDYDVRTFGRIEVSGGIDTPFASHLGEQVLAVQQEWAPKTGRIGLVIEFESGAVRCESLAGELRLHAINDVLREDNAP